MYCTFNITWLCSGVTDIYLFGACNCESSMKRNWSGEHEHCATRCSSGLSYPLQSLYLRCSIHFGYRIFLVPVHLNVFVLYAADEYEGRQWWSYHQVTYFVSRASAGCLSVYIILFIPCSFLFIINLFIVKCKSLPLI